MTDKLAENPKAEAGAKVIVFGVDDDCRPHAGWFPKPDADRARLAAKQLRLNVVEVTNGGAADLIGKLPPGRIHANGPGVVPVVREDLYDKVIAALNPRGEAGREPGESVATDLPATWDGIKPGHPVVAQDALVEG